MGSSVSSNKVRIAVTIASDQLVGILRLGDERVLVIWQHLMMKEWHRFDDYPRAELYSVAQEGKIYRSKGRCAMFGQRYPDIIAIVTTLTCSAWWKCTKCQCRERQA